MGEKLKVGIIGTGNISREHIAGYLNNPNVELRAFCDIDGEQVRKMGEKYGVSELYTDRDEMLRRADLDAVSVCTWNSAHAPSAIAALRAGKHVLCEKPMAMSAAEAREMKAAAQESGKLLMIGFVRRFGNDCAVLQDFIGGGYFGELYYAKATYLRRHGNPEGWFGDKARSGGGPLIDLGVHVIDLVRYLFGNPKPVSVYGVTFQKLLNRPGLKDRPGYIASSAKPGDVCDVEDMASALIRFDTGAVLSVETAYSLNRQGDEGTIELFGTKGGAKLTPELELYSDQCGYMVNTTLCRDTALSFTGLFQKEIDHFVSCALEGAACRAPADDGIELMRILDAVYESARTGHEVLL